MFQTKAVLPELSLSNFTARDDEGRAFVFGSELLAQLRKVREVLIQRERDTNNPSFVDEAILAGRQSIMPFSELESICNARAIDLLANTGVDIPSGLDSRTFEVLGVSIPHKVEDSVGSFPGEPTPLLTAFATIQSLVRMALFPGATIPNISLAYPPVASHPVSFEIVDRLQNSNVRVLALSTMAEGRALTWELANLALDVDPRRILILGGSYYDATNPCAIERAFRRRGVEYTSAAASRSDSLSFFGKAEERRPGIFVVGGDGSYALLKLLQIIGDNPHLDSATIGSAVAERRHEFAHCPGAGEVFWWNDSSQSVELASLSGHPIIRDLEPFISRGVTTNKFWIFDSKPTAQLMMSDGCPEACSFCHESADRGVAYFVPKVGRRSPENLLLEIKRIIANDGIAKYFFDDSYFLQKPAALERVVHGLVAIKTDQPDFEWGCQTTIDSIIDNRNLLPLLKKSGLSYVYVGLEGADPGKSESSEVTKVNRRSSIPGKPNATWMARFRCAAKLLQQNGVRMGASLLFGLGENLDDTQRLFSAIKRLHRSGTIPAEGIALNMVTLYPGTVDFHSEVLSGNRWVDYREQPTAPIEGFESYSQFSNGSPEYARMVREMAYSICKEAVVGYSLANRDHPPIEFNVSGGTVCLTPVSAKGALQKIRTSSGTLYIHRDGSSYTVPV